MKKIHWHVIILILCAFQLKAQKKSNFEGIVKYAFSYENSGLPPETTAMIGNAEVAMYITSEKPRTDLNMIIQSTTSIMDLKEKTISTIMDLAGKKFLIKTTKEEIEKEEKKEPELTIKYTEETKEIQGYKCKKAEVTSPDSPEIKIVYFTEEIILDEVKPVYNGLKGFPLEYAIDVGGIEMKIIAKSVSKEKVDETIFDITKDCVETTVDQFQTELLRQMGGQ